MPLKSCFGSNANLISLYKWFSKSLFSQNSVSGATFFFFQKINEPQKKNQTAINQISSLAVLLNRPQETWQEDVSARRAEPRSL